MAAFRGRRLISESAQINSPRIAKNLASYYTKAKLTRYCCMLYSPSLTLWLLHSYVASYIAKHENFILSWRIKRNQLATHRYKRHTIIIFGLIYPLAKLFLAKCFVRGNQANFNLAKLSHYTVAIQLARLLYVIFNQFSRYFLPALSHFITNQLIGKY